MILTLAQIPGWLISLLAILFLVVCLALVLIVLIQRPQGGGLSGAFGAGGGAGQTAFGTKTGDVLTLVTIGIFVLFLGTAIALNFAIRPPRAPAQSSQAVDPGAAQTENAAQRELDEMGDGTETPPPADAPAETEGDAEPIPPADAPTDPQPIPADPPGGDTT